MEGFHCIFSVQVTLPGSKGDHNGGVPLYILCTQSLYQVPKVTTMEGFHCIFSVQVTLPGSQGDHNGGVPLYILCTGYFTRFPR